MKANTTGGFNTAIGDHAQLANSAESDNLSNGNGTLNSANGDSNTTEIASLKAGMAQSVAISALPSPKYGKSNLQ